MHSALSPSTPRCGARPRGYALIAALILLVLATLAASAAVYRSSLDSRREREEQLLFAGRQIANALASYRDATLAGGLQQYPKSLEDLLIDRRFPYIKRHLRRLYADPMTGVPDWELERSQDRIVGVHSRSTQAPLRRAGFDAQDAAFAGANHYADWHFTAAAAAGTSAGAVPSSAAQPAPAATAPKPAAPDSASRASDPVPPSLRPLI
jgi:type II secretory pathway pseudopilin PulG